MTAASHTALRVVPATAERWPDLEALFGKSGGSGGCWCTFWRLPRADYKAMDAAGHKAVLRGLTLSDNVPGVLAYQGETPVGWCSVGPRADYAALENSRILKRVDDAAVWSVVCFYIARAYRGQGIAGALLRGALDYAVSQGARIVEGYPIDMNAPQLQGKKLTGYSGYMGIASLFRALGFQEVAQASETQRITRWFAP